MTFFQHTFFRRYQTLRNVAYCLAPTRITSKSLLRGFGVLFVSFFTLSLFSQTQNHRPSYLQRESGTIALDEDREKNKDLGEVVVTTTRRPRSLKDEPVITHVFTAQQIERLAAPALQDVLTSIIPGVQFEAQRGGSGATQSLRIQGLGGSYILFLLDGEPLSSKNGENFQKPRGGQVDFSRIDVNNIERIEYLPSGGSILHGSNSVGGVVNIITKKTKTPLQLQAGFRTTLPHQMRYELSGGNGGKKGDVRVSTSYTHNLPYVGYEELIKTPDGRDSVESVMLPGADIYTANLSGNYRPTSTLNLRGGLNWAHSAIYQQIETNEQISKAFNTGSGGGRLGMLWQMTPRYALDISMSLDHAKRTKDLWDKTTQQDVTEPDYENQILTTRAQYTWEHNSRHTTIIGAEHIGEWSKSIWLQDSTDNNQSNKVIYAQHDAKFFHNTFYLSYGLRYDHNSSFGGHVLHRLSLMQKVKRMDFRLLYSESFRSPTLTERFADISDPTGRFFYKGNPELQPETSRRYTAQIGHNHRRLNLSMSAFRADIQNLIQTQTIPTGRGGSIRKGVNTDKQATYWGMETMLRVQLPRGIYGQATYSYTHSASRTVIDDKGKSYNTSLTRPHSLTATLGHSWRVRRINIDANLTARYMARVDYWVRKNPNITTTMADEITVKEESASVVYHRVNEDAYHNIRFTTSFKFLRAYTLQLGIDNLTDYRPNSSNFTSALTDGRRFFMSFYVDIDKLLPRF